MLSWFFTKGNNVLTDSPKNTSPRDILNLRKYIIDVILAYPLSKLLGTGRADRTTYLRGDGVWSTIPSSSGGITDGDKGDITVSGVGTVFTIDNLAVTDAKINDVAWSKVTGEPTTLAGYGITDTKANFDTALNDGNFLYVGDVTTNATHTGEVTGSGALTVDKTAITNKTLVTAAVGDHVLVADASDADNLKRVTVQTIIDLASGGGLQQYQVRRMIRR